MAYTKRDGSVPLGNTDIYIYDFKTKLEKPIVADTVRESSPSWSPDGKIITMNPDGSQKSIIEKLQTSRAFYNANTDKIAFPAPFGEQNQPPIRIFDMKTKLITDVISKEVLNSLEFKETQSGYYNN